MNRRNMLRALGAIAVTASVQPVDLLTPLPQCASVFDGANFDGYAEHMQTGFNRLIAALDELIVALQEPTGLA